MLPIFRRLTSPHLAVRSRTTTTTTKSIRSISSTSIHFSRPPTFTTPQLPPTVYDDDPAQPLTPTDLPVEDYASPLAHTAGAFASLFRYSVLTSVTVVTVGALSLLGVHYYVEKVSLAGGNDDEGEAGGGAGGGMNWSEEMEGWSGKYFGGGTDPRLGTIARAVIRGAWIGQNWGAGTILSPVTTAPPPPPSNIGGATIGSSTSNPLALQEVADAGWLMAETNLVAGLAKANKRGISLCSSGGDSTTTPGQGGVDRAMIELEERLASVRELIGGQYRLMEAREGWKRIYYALSGSITPSAWERREKLRATKKLGDISARLGDMWNAGSVERKTEKEAAEGWLIGEVLTALKDEDNSHSKEVKKVSSPISSFFAFWSRSHPTASPSTRPEIDSLVTTLSRHALSPSSLDPATARAVLSSLVSLETLVARERRLDDARKILTAALDFARSQSRLIDPSQNINSTQQQTRNTTPTNLQLYQLHLLARSALFSTHLAEVNLALEKPEVESLSLLQQALDDCKLLLTFIDPSIGAKPSRTQAKVIKDLNRDSRLTGAMAARSIAHLHESRCGSLASKKSKGKSITWCGGDAMAAELYRQAMTLSRGASSSEEKKNKDEKAFDERGYQEAEKGLQRILAL